MSIELFLVETADFVNLNDVKELVGTFNFNPEQGQLGEFLKLVLSENKLDLSNLEHKVVLDSEGSQVNLEITLSDWLALQESKEKTILFVFGPSCSSEEDLNFVNSVWKKYESDSGSFFL